MESYKRKIHCFDQMVDFYFTYIYISSHSSINVTDIILVFLRVGVARCSGVVVA